MEGGATATEVLLSFLSDNCSGDWEKDPAVKIEGLSALMRGT